MLRFILKRRFSNTETGLLVENFETFDAHVQQLERLLSRGGSGPSGFDITDLVGVEVIRDDLQSSPIDVKGGA